MYHRLCGARIGWTYFDYPLASLELFTDRVVVRAIAGPSATVRLEHLTALRMTREIVATLLELVHSDNAPEVAVWVSDPGRLADRISRASGRILSDA